MIVRSQDLSKAATYTISQSSGDEVLFLQDGLISQYKLTEHKPTKFIYTNPTRSPVYLHISAPDTSAFGKIKTEVYAMDDVED